MENFWLIFNFNYHFIVPKYILLIIVDIRKLIIKNVINLVFYFPRISDQILPFFFLSVRRNWLRSCINCVLRRFLLQRDHRLGAEVLLRLVRESFTLDYLRQSMEHFALSHIWHKHFLHVRRFIFCRHVPW